MSTETVEDLYNRFMTKINRKKQELPNNNNNQDNLTSTLIIHQKENINNSNSNNNTAFRTQNQTPENQKKVVSILQNNNNKTRHDRQFSFHKNESNYNRFQIISNNNNNNSNSNNISQQVTKRNNNFSVSGNHHFQIQNRQSSNSPNQYLNRSVNQQNIGNTASFSPIRNSSPLQNRSNNLSPVNSKLNFGQSNRSFTSTGMLNNVGGISPINSNNQRLQQQQSFFQSSNNQIKSQPSTSRAFSSAMNALQNKIQELEREKEDDKLKSIEAFQDYENEIGTKQEQYQEELNSIKEVEKQLKEKVEELERIVEGMSNENKSLIFENNDISQNFQLQQKTNQEMEEQLRLQQKKYTKSIDLLNEEIQYMQKWKDEQKILYGQLLKEREDIQDESGEHLLVIEKQQQEIQYLKTEIEKKNCVVIQKDSQINEQNQKSEFSNKEMIDLRGDYNKQLQDFQGDLQQIETAYKQRIEELENQNIILVQENKRGCQLLEQREMEYQQLEQKHSKTKSRYFEMKKQVQQLSNKCSNCQKIEIRKLSTSKSQIHTTLNPNNHNNSSSKKFTPAKKPKDFSQSLNQQQQQQQSYQLQQIQQLTSAITTESDDISQITSKQVKSKFNKTDEKPSNNSLIQRKYSPQPSQFQQKQQQQQSFLKKSNQNNSQQQLFNNNSSIQYQPYEFNQQNLNGNISPHSNSQLQRNQLNNMVQNINQDRLEQDKQEQQQFIAQKQKLLSQKLQNSQQNLLQKDASQGLEQLQNVLEMQYEQVQQRYQQQLLNSNNQNSQNKNSFQISPINNNNNNPLLDASNNNINNLQQQQNVNVNTFMSKDLSIADLQNIQEQKDLNSKNQQQYEMVLKMIIETEKTAVQLNKSYQNILNESLKVVEEKQKAEYRGRLIEINEQIKNNNDKLYLLKKKEHHIMGQLNNNNSQSQFI